MLGNLLHHFRRREADHMTDAIELPATLAHSHYVELTEHHEISVELAGWPDELHRAAILADTRAAALDWMEDEGVSATVLLLQRGSPPTFGCTFDITVAKAVASPTGSDHKWRWSNRWRAWLQRFAAMRRAEQHAPSHPIQSSMLADVIPLTEDRLTRRAPKDPT